MIILDLEHQEIVSLPRGNETLKKVNGGFSRLTASSYVNAFARGSIAAYTVTKTQSVTRFIEPFQFQDLFIFD